MLAQLLHLEGIESVVLESAQPRVRRGTASARACSSRAPSTCSPRRAWASGWPRGPRPRRHRAAVRRRAAPDRHGGAHRRQDDHRLRPDRGREGPDRGAARHRAAAAVRGRAMSASHDLESERPRVRYAHEGGAARARVRRRRRLRRLPRRLPADDSRRRSARRSRASTRSAGSGSWPRCAPSSDELVYAHHERGFALLSLRSPELSRLYVQCRPDEDIAEWPDERIWEELQIAPRPRRAGRSRRAPCWRRASRRCAASSPSRCGTGACSSQATPRTSCPPTGAKGLNLAVHDVRLLAEALVEWYAHGSETLLDATRRTACAASGVPSTSPGG